MALECSRYVAKGRHFPLPNGKHFPIVLDGIYKKVPTAARPCPTSTEETATTTEYIWLHCPFPQETHSKFIFPLLNRYPNCLDLVYAKMLLMSEIPQITAFSVKFYAGACKIHQKDMHWRILKFLITFAFIFSSKYCLFIYYLLQIMWPVMV